MVEASSAGVYGQATSAVQAESDATDPNWEYGVSKLACEKYSAIFCERTTGLSVASLRYAIVYGEREWYGRVLTLFLKRALEGQSPVVFGAGDQIRDFVYAGDIAVLHRGASKPTSTVTSFSTARRASAPPSSSSPTAICDLAGDRLEPIYDDVAEGEVSQLAGGRMRLPSELMAMRMSYERAHAHRRMGAEGLARRRARARVEVAPGQPAPLERDELLRPCRRPRPLTAPASTRSRGLRPLEPGRAVRLLAEAAAGPVPRAVAARRTRPRARLCDG